jgi:2-methylcitrate dehydratase PrpD
LVDWFGSVMLGHHSAAGEAISRWAAHAPKGACWTVGGLQLNSDAAAMFNGCLGNIYELDDLHRGAVVHPADTIMAAALAVAQREKVSPHAFLDSVVRGYEMAIRIGLLAGTQHYQHWYSTATCGVFGAATACASLLQLNAHQAANALAQAGMQASGVWQCRLEPGFSKQLATGRSAQSGVLAADLASAGLEGPRHILEGQHGWLAATNSMPTMKHAMAVLTPEAGSPWLIHEVSFKPWPVCRHVHPAIACAIQLHKKIGPVDDIVRIEISTYQTALDFANQPQPSNSQEARFSLQHGVAVALLRGDFWLDDTQSEALNLPQLVRLRQQTQVRAHKNWNAAYPAHYGAKLSVWLRNGQCLEASLSDAPGDPENPLSSTEILKKNRAVMRSANCASESITQLMKACAELPQAASMASLWRALNKLQKV